MACSAASCSRSAAGWGLHGKAARQFGIRNSTTWSRRISAIVARSRGARTRPRTARATGREAPRTAGLPASAAGALPTAWRRRHRRRQATDGLVGRDFGLGRRRERSCPASLNGHFASRMRIFRFREDESSDARQESAAYRCAMVTHKAAIGPQPQPHGGRRTPTTVTSTREGAPTGNGQCVRSRKPFDLATPSRGFWWRLAVRCPSKGRSHGSANSRTNQGRLSPGSESEKRSQAAGRDGSRCDGVRRDLPGAGPGFAAHRALRTFRRRPRDGRVGDRRIEQPAMRRRAEFGYSCPSRSLAPRDVGAAKRPDL